MPLKDAVKAMFFGGTRTGDDTLAEEDCLTEGDNVIEAGTLMEEDTLTEGGHSNRGKNLGFVLWRSARSGPLVFVSPSSALF